MHLDIFTDPSLQLQLMDLTHDKLWKEIKGSALWDNDYL